MNISETLGGMAGGLKTFLQQCRRVLLVSAKPDKEEYNMSVKITGIGMVIIGVIGFALFMLFQVLILNGVVL
jgi:protein transport protein SEC61 subunit gamma-like protein